MSPTRPYSIHIPYRFRSPRAQVAKQQGEFLAALLGQGAVRSGDALPAGAKPFKYSHKGSLAYVGSDKAVMDVPAVGPIFGWGAGAPGRPPPGACCRMVGPAAGRPLVRCL
jgi:NADH dehydrogenase FAD-containing subunit